MQLPDRQNLVIARTVIEQDGIHLEFQCTSMHTKKDEPKSEAGHANPIKAEAQREGN